MTSDFYRDEALSGRTPVEVVMETDDVLAFHHTRPHWAVHIVVVPKIHTPSLTNLGGHSVELVHRVLDVVRKVAARVETTPRSQLHAHGGSDRADAELGRAAWDAILEYMSSAEGV